MGYYSDFEIRLQGVTDTETLDTVIDLLQEATQYEFCTYGDGVIYSGDRYKWYGHEDDMADLSRDFPSVVFEMRITGEDSAQVQVFAKDGKVYRNYVEPVWPEFDESQLP